MTYRAIDERTVALRLDPGDDVHDSIERIFTQKDWESGFVWGLGSIENPVLAHYKITNKEYSEKPLHGIFELTSLNGTVSVLDGKLSVHIHVTLTDEEMKAYGGHLVSGKCSATAEVVLKRVDEPMVKKLSEQSGLNVWEFDGKEN